MPALFHLAVFIQVLCKFGQIMLFLWTLSRFNEISLKVDNFVWDMEHNNQAQWFSGSGCLCALCRFDTAEIQSLDSHAWIPWKWMGQSRLRGQVDVHNNIGGVYDLRKLCSMNNCMICAYYAQISQHYANYPQNMQQLCTNYSQIRHKLRTNDATIANNHAQTIKY